MNFLVDAHLPPALPRPVNQVAAEIDTSRAHGGSVSEEFEATLHAVTGCAVGSNSLRRLLADQRRERERDEAWPRVRKPA